jgi:outer membrane protein
VRGRRSEDGGDSSAESDGSSLAAKRGTTEAPSYLEKTTMLTRCHLLALAMSAGTSAVLVAPAGRASAPERPPPPSPATPASAQRVVTLAEVERVAIQQQPQLLVARANTRVAEAQADQARAPMLPQVTGTAAYTRQTGNYAPRPGATVTTPGVAQPGGASGWTMSPNYDYWNFGVTATQLIYDFGQTPQRYHAAELNADAQRFTEQTTRVQIVLTVRRAYFNARANKELVDVARETLDDQNKHLMQVQGYVQVGTQPPIALAQQKAAVANALVQLITAQNNYETAKAQLNQAAGIPGGTDYEVSDEEMPGVADEDQPLEVLAAKAVAARPELAALVKQREVQEATLESARGGYGPTFSASAGATEQGLQLDQMVPNWNVGVGLTWSIFQGGLTRAQVRQAEAGLESVDAQRSLEELQVRLDVDSARLAVRAAKATMGAVDDALTSAREQLRLAEQRYATGVGNIIELVDAQVAYTGAAAQVVQARYGLASARAQLLAALGRS